VEKHDAKEESQEHLNDEISAPLNLNVVSSPVHEQVQHQAEAKNMKGQYKKLSL